MAILLIFVYKCRKKAFSYNGLYQCVIGKLLIMSIETFCVKCMPSLSKVVPGPGRTMPIDCAVTSSGSRTTTKIKISTDLR